MIGMNVGDNAQIPGCTTKKRILETSSGCDSFDVLCGGGLTNGSIVLIDEMKSRHYGSYLVQYFLAEGLHNNHTCLLADPFFDKEKSIIKKIPSKKESVDKIEDMRSPQIPSNDRMDIAWRYSGMKTIESELKSTKENAFDFSKSLESPAVEVYESDSYRDLYSRISEIIKTNEVHTKGSGRGGPKKNLLRIVIQNIDSPVWKDSDDIGKFLILLRTLLRNSFAIVYLITNSSQISTSKWKTIESFGDVHVQLVGFDEDEKKSFRHLGNVHGYFRLKNLPRLSSVGFHTPPILDLIFEAQSAKGFQIKIMHLPPALEDPSPQKNQSGSCQKIDF